MKKIVAPKGFSLRVKKFSNNYYQIQLKVLEKDSIIGHVDLIKVRPGYYETHSYLNNKYHKKGLGALLYSRAIQYGLEKGWRVQSSGSSSQAAQRVWRGKTIRKFFSIKLKKDPVNSSYDKWYAYEK